jgi:hypothetical protein
MPPDRPVNLDINAYVAALRRQREHHADVAAEYEAKLGTALAEIDALKDELAKIKQPESDGA